MKRMRVAGWRLGQNMLCPRQEFELGGWGGCGGGLVAAGYYYGG